MKLEINDLFVGYEAGIVLKDLSLSVEEGEFVSLLGPSGCGKTTLMKTIAGILPVKRGSIFLNGRDITNLPIHRRGTVIVFQDMRLFPHQSVAENVAFPLKMQGVPRAQRLKTAEELLEKVQMAGLGGRRPSDLSGGQQQRVALARALAAKPQLLLLDEPFSALDENLREDMRSLVLRLRKEFDMTVILVTHDREEALSMSDRVALMFNGEIAQIGMPQSVYCRPASRRVADYFGDCTYIAGTVSGRVFDGNGIVCKAEMPDGKYVLMLRTNDFHPEIPGNYRVRVDALSFRGSDTQVTFRAADGTVWKKAYSRTPELQPGDEILASVSTENGILFPKEN